MPRRSSDIYGRTDLDQYQLRPTLFGVRLEKLVQDHDGTRRWVKCTHVYPLRMGDKG